MNKIVGLITLVIVSIHCFGQNHFEKGYFINNRNVKTDCLIKDVDWLKNPTQFKFKVSENGSVSTEDIGNIKEFGIYNICRFVRADVDIDNSPSDLKNLTIDKNPLWQRKLVFLKVLVEGKANLYYYRNDSYERFFYSCKDTSIKQLVYKEYNADGEHTSFNETFRLQLNNDVVCESSSDFSLASLTCEKKSLEKYFIDYNTCMDPTYKATQKKQNKGQFVLSLSTGLAYTSLSISNDLLSYAGADFGKKIIGAYSMELEYILPFNNHKWSIALSPTYQSFHSETQTDFKKNSIDFSSIDLAIGLKHHLFLSDKLKLFVGCYINSILNKNLNSKIGYKVSTSQNMTYLEVTESYNTNFLIAAGIEYKRFFAEARYYTMQNILSHYGSWNSEYNKIAFNIGYRLLKL